VTVSDVLQLNAEPPNRQEGGGPPSDVPAVQQRGAVVLP
jgi:hypothetical protein